MNWIFGKILADKIVYYIRICCIRFRIYTYKGTSNNLGSDFGCENRWWLELYQKNPASIPTLNFLISAMRLTVPYFDNVYSGLKLFNSLDGYFHLMNEVDVYHSLCLQVFPFIWKLSSYQWMFALRILMRCLIHKYK